MKAGKATGGKRSRTQKPKGQNPCIEALAPKVQIRKAFPIVGLGASAGGLAAFEEFFSGMPANTDPGMAFVLVQHLAPDHKSLLTSLIQRCTRMEVFEAGDGMVVRPNCVYIIPPGCDMAFLNGSLQLLEPSAPRGQRLPIDFFFRSLAQDQHERAIGIVLAGTGSDGTFGVRAIKGEGGLVIAQSPDSTEFDGMPRSAIATGLADYTLPPAQMPTQLIAYTKNAFFVAQRSVTDPTPGSGNAIKKILILLRAQTGHDFSQYKPSTIHRRIERRMAMHQIDAADGYVKFLQQKPEEAQLLFQDLLIGVTSFFRDKEAFDVLEKKVIPQLFAGKQSDGAIRVWSAGCSTGEEAYSLAILLAERMEALQQSHRVQVFATDIDKRAISSARAGFYPSSITADLSPSRLARFFTTASDGYRIRREIRDLLIFSEQNLIKDPPFSRLDLICCRNLMIYLGSDLQKRLIPLFHYALNPGGFLMLGTSEGIGEFEALFSVEDRKMKIYQRKTKSPNSRQEEPIRYLPPMPAVDAGLHKPATKMLSPTRLPLRELTEQALLQQVVAAAALVRNQGDILYLHGRSGMFLEPSAGEAGVNNILKMAREGLKQELSSMLRKAVETKDTVQALGLQVKTNSHFSAVNLTVRPVVDALSDTQLFLIILEEAPKALEVGGQNPGISSLSQDADARITALRQELRAKEEYLQSTCEELESSAEELKSSNEEMQSVNEEMQSTNEELETAKEELQSVNEELSTVNTELQNKVNDLSQANNDMNNLLSGTGVATLFVDHQLQILRFTPCASEIINLIPGDIGRPVAHLVSNLVDYQSLVEDLKSVLDTLIPQEAEVLTTGGKWFKMRIQPYRTIDNVIEGAVVSFTDITEIVQTRKNLHKANESLRLAVVVRDARDAITVQDLDGRTLAWNPGAERLYGWTEAEALSMNVRDRIPPELRPGALDKLHQLSQTEILEPYLTRRISKNGKALEVSIISTALLNETGVMYAVSTTERAKGGK